jgi:single-stranded-DNA-specific exonuclease
MLQPEAPSSIAEALSKELCIDINIAKLLAARGITETSQAQKFFSPSVADLHSPFLMADMDKAAKRLSEAISSGEKILVYGDYDVDGTTAVAMMYMFLKKTGAATGYYIPDRYKEGYGVSEKGIRYAAEFGYGLIITLDCGIRANDKIDMAASLGIDVIICDHHNAGSTLPKAFAVLDPKRPGCSYPFKELSGCGVGFKLMHAVCISNKLCTKDYLFRFVDLLAVSIASDIVPVVDENRIFAHYGIKKLQLSPLPGLGALMQVAGIQGKAGISLSDLVFKIGPRINAAGRIDAGARAVKLLIAGTVEAALGYASEVDGYNEERKGIDKSITQEALQMLEMDTASADKKTTVVYSPSWHKGVVGIVASRLIEHWYRPTIVLTKSEGKITGSARSVEGFDLYAAIACCDDLLTNWGGHKYAAGVNMKEDKLGEFIARFEKSVAESITADQLIPKVNIDMELDISSIDAAMYSSLKKFEPFGPGNMAPIFSTKAVKAADGSRAIGADGSHLRIVAECGKSNKKITGVAFGMGAAAEDIMSAPINIAYSIEENNFRGNTSLQLMIKDIVCC